jgi:peroxiredoxin family protein
VNSNKEKVAIIVNSASYDRVAYALTIALVSASMGKEVHVLFTYNAINRLRKGNVDQVGEETDKSIREAIKTGLKKGSIGKISDILRDLKRFGGKVYACVAAMAFHNLTKDELIENVDHVIGIAAFLEIVEGASITLYI